MFDVIVGAALTIYQAYTVYENSTRDKEGLEDFYKRQKEQYAKILQESKNYASRQIVEDSFDDLHREVETQTKSLDLMLNNPNQSYQSIISFAALHAQSFVAGAIMDVIKYESELADVEGLLVSAIAYAGDFFALCATSTIREEQLDSNLDLDYLRTQSRKETQDNAELAMELLRSRSNRRFKFSSRPIGEPIPSRPDSSGPSRMLVYGYTFAGKRYENTADIGYPGRNNSSVIARVRRKMIEHQNKEFPNFPGVKEIDQIIANLPSVSVAPDHALEVLNGPSYKLDESLKVKALRLKAMRPAVWNPGNESSAQGLDIDTQILRKKQGKR